MIYLQFIIYGDEMGVWLASISLFFKTDKLQTKAKIKFKKNQEKTNMKIYILTDCAAGRNYTPTAFKTKEEAQKTMKQWYNDYIENDPEAVVEKSIYDNTAEIVYGDDSYNRLEIFEVELED